MRNKILIFVAGFCLMATAIAGVILLTKKKTPAPSPKAETKASVTTPTLPAANQQPTLQICKDRRYEVVKGDWLIKIATREYGNRGYLYLLLAEANGITNPNLIYPGQVLVIPCCICNLPAITKQVSKVRKVVKPRPVVKTTVCPTATCPPPSAPAVQQPTPAPVPVPKPSESQPTAPRAPPAAAQASTQVNVNQQVVVETPKPAPTPAPVETPKLAPPAPQKPISQAKLPEPPAIEPPPPPEVAPGSMWNTALTTPLEKGNKLNYFHVDQGLVIGRIGKIEVEPYVALNATKDTKGYQWNNRVEGEVGLKLVRPFRNGLVIFGGAYAGEWRAHVNGVRSQTKYAPIGYFSDWFGWKQPTANSSKGRKMFRSFPGTTWFTVGNISPYERNNVIGLGRLEQGVTLLRLGRVSVIPQGTFQMGFDTDKNAWNNRYTYGGGVKIAIPWRTAAFDVQGGYECAQQYRGLGSNGPSVCGPIVRINLWTGWRKKVGGQ